MTRSVKVAVCGHLPTACDFLLKTGMVNIESFTSATEMPSETNYNLILVYAPQGEGLLNTSYSCQDEENDGIKRVPVRLLNEPCCKSALIELKSMVRRISVQLETEAG